MRQLLSDVLVVDLAQEPAGSYCGKVFADLGADVVKVEPITGDPLRARRGAFAHLNTNKQSIRADLAASLGMARVHRLLGAADLVIETEGKGDLASLGINRAELLAQFPRLVVTTISGWGATGPYSGFRWTDLTAQASSWFTLPSGLSATIPVKSPGISALCDLGQTAALGGLAAVSRSRASGVGAHIDCAAFEALATTPSRAGRYLGFEYADRTPFPPAVDAGGTIIPCGVFACLDGHVSLMSTPQQLREMLDVLDDDNLRAAFAHPDAFVRPETKEAIDAALYPWLFSHTRAEMTLRAQAAGWPFAGVNTPQEVLAADHLHQRGFWVDVDDPAIGRVKLPGPPYRHGEGGWRLRRPAPTLGFDEEAVDRRLATPRTPPHGTAGLKTDASTPPLRGVRVLDLTTVWSGPFATQLLADLGAEVIRIENPSVFPPTTKGFVPRPSAAMPLQPGYAAALPDRPDRPYNRRSANNSIARNKLSCTLDPRHPEASPLFWRLVAEADVVIENLKTSTLHRIGIQEGELLDANPRLIVVRLPPAGLSGDWASYTGFGGQFDGLSGMTYLTGHHESDPVETPITTYMDAVTGPAAAFATVAALHYRDATGRGQLIELAQIENSLNHLGDIFVDAQLGVDVIRRGNRELGMAPQGIYATADGKWLAVSASDDATWLALAQAIGRSDLAADATLRELPGRFAAYDRLDAAVAEFVGKQPVIDAFHALQTVGVPSSPLMDDELIADDPHVAARGWIRPLRSSDVGEHLHLGPAFGGIPQAWDRGSPTLGEDNEYVYKKLLGLDDAEYQRLEAAGIITNDYVDAEGNAL